MRRVSLPIGVLMDLIALEEALMALPLLLPIVGSGGRLSVQLLDGIGPIEPSYVGRWLRIVGDTLELHEIALDERLARVSLVHFGQKEIQ